jgi:hypothetical protein
MEKESAINPSLDKTLGAEIFSMPSPNRPWEQQCPEMNQSEPVHNCTFHIAFSSLPRPKALK